MQRPRIASTVALATSVGVVGSPHLLVVRAGNSLGPGPARPGRMLRTCEIVNVFVLSYTPHFHIVELSTDDSKQDIHSHMITMHAVTSDYAGMISSCDVRCW